jgi:hypothetical protein
MTTDGHPYQHDEGSANERTFGIRITGELGRGCPLGGPEVRGQVVVLDPVAASRASSAVPFGRGY